MGYFEEICRYQPMNRQEEIDQATMIEFIERNPESALLRDNRVAHVSSSAFILNPAMTHTLMILHHLRGAWAWTGGHADGERDLLKVALTEAREEAGLTAVEPLFPHIASLDMLTVQPHVRKGEYVGAHLHLSVSYILIADDKAPLQRNIQETDDICWLPAEQLTTERFDAFDAYLYNKMLEKARMMG